MLPRFGMPRLFGLDLPPDHASAVWLADTDLGWDDIEALGEEPTPELLAEFGVKVTTDEVRMDGLALPLSVSSCDVDSRTVS